MKKLLLISLAFHLSLATAFAQKAVVEEYAVEVTCESATHAVQHFRKVTTILSEQGASLATFVCSCSKNDRLTSFKGVVNDSMGRIIRKLKESELKKTEYSPYLAIDDYKIFLDYTPPVYPVTITYEWTVDSRDTLNRTSMPRSASVTSPTMSSSSPWKSATSPCSRRSLSPLR